MTKQAATRTPAQTPYPFTTTEAARASVWNDAFGTGVAAAFVGGLSHA